MVAGDLGTADHVPLWAYGLPAVAMAGLVAATLLQGRIRPAVPLRQSLAIQCGASAVLFTGLALVTHTAVPPPRSAFWIAAVWFAFLSFAGYGLYWANMARAGATRVSSLISLTPPTTALWALAMFGQPLSPDIVVGMVISLVGVVLAAGRRSLRAAAPAQQIGEVPDASARALVDAAP